MVNYGYTSCSSTCHNRRNTISIEHSNDVKEYNCTADKNDFTCCFCHTLFHDVALGSRLRSSNGYSLHATDSFESVTSSVVHGISDFFVGSSLMVVFYFKGFYLVFHFG